MMHKMVIKKFAQKAIKKILGGSETDTPQESSGDPLKDLGRQLENIFKR